MRFAFRLLLILSKYKIVVLFGQNAKHAQKTSTHITVPFGRMTSADISAQTEAQTRKRIIDRVARQEDEDRE